jgi:opacity protein-like surface antigen
MSTKRLFACAMAIACMPGFARAQDRSASVGGGVSAFNMDSHTSVAYAASVDFRFTRVLGLELEGTFVPSLNAPYPGSDLIARTGAVDIFPSIPTVTIFPLFKVSNEGGRVAIWSNNVRVAIPTTAARLEPFFVAGGGVAAVRHTADVTLSLPSLGIGIPGIPQGDRTFTQPLSTSSVGLALTLGGGVGIRATDHLRIDADLRLIRIMDNDDKNVGRFGVGVGYRF